MAAATGRLAELVAANCPVFHLHPEDHFMPTTVEEFMLHSELQQLQSPSAGCTAASQWVTLLQRKQVNSAALAAAQQRFKGRGAMRLALSDAARCGFPKDRIDDVPLYVNTKEVLNSSGDVEALELNYMTFYAYNGHYNVFGMAVGAHTGDWEHVTVRLDANTGRTLGMYYHAHRNHDGVWLPVEAMPRDTKGSGRPAAFVAFHGHGCYPSPGRHLRALLVANDLCSAYGPVWRPRRCVLLPHLSGRPDPPPYAPHRQIGNRMIMRVPSRGTSLPIFAASSLPSEQPDSKSRHNSHSSSPVNGPTSSLAADLNASATLPSMRRVSDTQQCPDSRKLPTASANTEAHASSCERLPALERSEQQVSGRGSYPEGGANRGQDECAAHHAAATPRADSAATPSPVDTEGPQTQAGDSTEATPLPASLDLADHELGNVREQLVDAIQSLRLGGEGSAGVEVVEDPSEWLFYEGHWGNTPAPIVQKWFLGAEPPVSRTLLRRILHFPAEQALPQQQ